MVPRFDASDGPVHAWQHALDLRDPACDEVVVLYHYTNALAFESIANWTAELLASLLEKRTQFGEGVYASQHEPSVWQLRLRILLNNYGNASLFRQSEDAEANRVRSEWGDESASGHRAAFCIPMLVSRAMAYSIFDGQRPDSEARAAWEATSEEQEDRLHEDYMAKAADRARDVWVVLVADAPGE
ncbi:kidins220, partial [Symbiodinium sp. KB8]